MSWSKLFSDLVCSSIWNEDDPTRIVWITMLAIKGPNHIVRATVGGLAHQARVSVSDCRKAVEKLTSPDPDGLDQPYEGRRIQAVDHGWLVLNGETYKNRRDETYRKEYQADWVKAKRLKEKLSTQSVDVDSESTDVDTSRAEQIREEKSRQEQIKPPTPLQGAVVFPVNLDSDRFKKAWAQWKAHRVEKRKKMTPTQEQKQLDRLEALGPDRAIAAIDYSIAQGWTGIFEESLPLIPSKNGNQKPETQQFVTREMVEDWCFRRKFSRLADTAWGKLMGGKHFGVVIDNRENFESAMAAILSDWKKEP
jgi:hypothetical protein